MKQLTLTFCIKHERTQRVSSLVLHLLDSGVPTMMGWDYTATVKIAKRAVSKGIAKRYYS